MYGSRESAEQRSTDPRSAPASRVRSSRATPTRTISTSYVERQNLTMRMGMRRFTRLTNAFSKKVENHAHAVSLHFMHYNFGRPHLTLTTRPGAHHPSDGRGVVAHPWSLTQLAELLESN